MYEYYSRTLIYGASIERSPQYNERFSLNYPTNRKTYGKEPR